MLLRLIMADLKQLTTVEIAYALVSFLPHDHHDQDNTLYDPAPPKVGECTTITMWGRLGRQGSRRLQLGMNTYYFLSR